MGKRHLYVLCGILFAIGTGVLLYRHLVLDFPLIPEQTRETWSIEARIAFDASNKPVKATLVVPRSAPGLTVLGWSYIAPGFGVTTDTQGDNRQATFSTRVSDGRQVLYYRANVQRGLSRETAARAAEPELQRSRYTGARREAARAIHAEVDAASADSETYVRLLSAALNQRAGGTEAAFLLGDRPTQRLLVEVAVNVLSFAGIPARSVHGLPLTPDRRQAAFAHWLEVYWDNAWHAFDPTTGEFGTPKDHLPWWQGNQPFVTVTGGTNVQSVLAVRRTFEFALTSARSGARDNPGLIAQLSFIGLPLQTQEVYRSLLAVPFGILLLVVLRNVVGLKTFGTFMPVLIALAFRSTGLTWGIVLFGVVLAIGLGVRFYLEQLKLLLVPRLASVVIVVIGTMAILSIASHKLGFDRGLSVALFPIVILAMTIERMTVVWDERGAREAFQQAGGSLGVAVLCYLVMNIEVVQHIAFVFPETLLFILAFCLMLGRYAGYRLVELPRFKVLAGGNR